MGVVGRERQKNGREPEIAGQRQQFGHGALASRGSEGDFGSHHGDDVQDTFGQLFGTGPFRVAGGLLQLRQESVISLPFGKSLEGGRVGFDVHRCLNGGSVTLELVEEQVDQTSARRGGVGVLQQQVPTSCFWYGADLLQPSTQEEDKRKSRVEEPVVFREFVDRLGRPLDEQRTYVGWRFRAIRF